MAYSHSRLRKMLALVRILTGGVFVSVGMFKVTSLEFARVIFPSFLDSGMQGGAVEWVRPALEWIVSFGAGKIGDTIGFIELFIGIAMVLGLAVRPAALVGMLYSVGLFLGTWNQAVSTPSMLQNAEHQFRNLFPFLIFLLLGIGHAGETWGLGALYHHHRLKWQRENAPPPMPAVFNEPAEQEPDSFAEFFDDEETSAADRQHALSGAEGRGRRYN